MAQWTRLIDANFVVGWTVGVATATLLYAAVMYAYIVVSA